MISLAKAAGVLKYAFFTLSHSKHPVFFNASPYFRIVFTCQGTSGQMPLKCSLIWPQFRKSIVGFHRGTEVREGRCIVASGKCACLRIVGYLRSFPGSLLLLPYAERSIALQLLRYIHEIDFVAHVVCTLLSSLCAGHAGHQHTSCTMIRNQTLSCSLTARLISSSFFPSPIMPR